MNIAGSGATGGEQQGRDCKAVCVASMHHPTWTGTFTGALGTRLHHPWVKLVPITPEAAFSLLKSVKDIAPKLEDLRLPKGKHSGRGGIN